MPRSRPQASWLGQVESYVKDRGMPGVCLGDGQTEAEGDPSPGGRGDVLLRHMADTCPNLIHKTDVENYGVAKLKLTC